MIQMIRKLGAIYLSFGVGIIVGTIIASTVAAILMLSTLDAHHLERINEFSEEIKNK